MRIAFLIYGSLDQVSGGYLYDRKVVEYLRGQGVTVELFQLPVLPYLLCPLHNLYAPLRRLLGDPHRHDAIVIDELTHPSVFGLVSERDGDRPPLVLLVHHLKSQERIGPFVKGLSRAMERKLLRSCDALIVNSRTTRESVGRLAEPRVPVYICLPGADTFGEDTQVPPSARGREAPAASRGGLRLLMTGNIIPRKGHDLLIRLLAGLSDLSWELRVVGAAVDPSYKRKVDRLARHHGLQSRIHYTGVLSGEALVLEYRQADLFVFPSRYEGFGISLAEAIRFGLPFLAFASGAIPEVTGGQGLLVAEDDFRGFQLHLRRLIADRDFRAQAAELSRRLAAGLPTWRQTGQAFFEALKAIV